MSPEWSLYSKIMIRLSFRKKRMKCQVRNLGINMTDRHRRLFFQRRLTAHITLFLPYLKVPGRKSGLYQLSWIKKKMQSRTLQMYKPLDYVRQRLALPLHLPIRKKYHRAIRKARKIFQTVNPVSVWKRLILTGTGCQNSKLNFLKTQKFVMKRAIF